MRYSSRHRGFSTLETVLALGIFLAVVGTVAATSVQLLGALARAEARQQTVAAMETALNELSTRPFDELVGLQFNAPAPCGTQGQPARTSCLQAGQRQVQVSYDTSSLTPTRIKAVDTTGATQAAGVTLVAVAVLADGSTVTRSREVPMPSTGFGDQSLVRIRSLADNPAHHLPVVILNAALQQVSPPIAFSNSVATVRLPAQACAATSGGPCRLGLDATASFWQLDSFVLDPAYVVGPASSFTTAPGALLDISVLSAPKATGSVAVLARSPGLPAQAGAPPRSVCLWATLPFAWDAANTVLPLCNDDGDTVPLTGFWHPTTDPLSPFFGQFIPFPDTLALNLHIDNPSNTCPGPEAFAPNRQQLGWVDNLWVPLPVCTSWTWGTPEMFGLSRQSVPTVFPVQVNANTTYDMVFVSSSPTATDIAVGQNSTLQVRDIPAPTALSVALSFTPDTWLPQPTTTLGAVCPQTQQPDTPVALRVVGSFGSDTPNGERWIVALASTDSDVFLTFTRSSPTTTITACARRDDGALAAVPFTQGVPVSLRVTHDPALPTPTVSFQAQSALSDLAQIDALGVPQNVSAYQPAQGAGTFSLFAAPGFEAVGMTPLTGLVSAMELSADPSLPAVASLNLATITDTPTTLIAGSSWDKRGAITPLFAPGLGQPAAGSLTVGAWAKPRSALNPTCQNAPCPSVVGQRPEAVAPTPTFTTLSSLQDLTASSISWQAGEAGSFNTTTDTTAVLGELLPVGDNGAVQLVVGQPTDSTFDSSLALSQNTFGFWWGIPDTTTPGTAPTAGWALLYTPAMPTDLAAFAAALFTETPPPPPGPGGWVLLDFADGRHQARAASQPATGSTVTSVFADGVFAVYLSATPTPLPQALSGDVLFSGRAPVTGPYVSPVAIGGVTLSEFVAASLSLQGPPCAVDMFCLSPANAPPKVVSPAFPFAQRYADNMGTPLTMPVTVRDYEGDAISWSMSTPPVTGSVCLPALCPQPLDLTTQPLPPSGTLDFVYLNNSLPPVAQFSFTFSDPTNATSTTALAYNNDSPPVWFSQSMTTQGPEPVVVVPQGGQALVQAFVAGPSLGVLPGVATTVLQASPGITVSPATLTSGVSDADGKVVYRLSAGSVAAGDYIATLAAGATNLTIPIRVTPTAANVGVTVGTNTTQPVAALAQGGSETVVFAATDLAGNALANVPLRIEVLDGGRPAPSVRPESSACILSTAGTCSVPITASSSAAAGFYSVTASAGSATTSQSFAVTPVIAEISVNSNSGANQSSRSAATSYSQLVESYGAAAVWSFDDLSNPLTSSNATTGSASGIVAFGREPLAGGRGSFSAYFDGTSSLTLPSPVDVGTQGFTTEAWIRPESVTGTATVLAGGDTQTGYNMYVRNGEVVVGVWSPSWSPQLVSLSAPVNRNETYLVSLTVLPTGTTAQLSLTVNGTTRAQRSLPGPFLLPSTEFNVGGSIPTVVSSPTSANGTALTPSSFQGLIDEVTIFPLPTTSSAATRFSVGSQMAAASNVALVTVVQGGVTPINITVRDGNRTPVSDASVVVGDIPPGLELAPSVTTGTSGRAALLVTATGDAPLGITSFTLSSSPANQQVLVTVLGAVASLDAPTVTIPQGGRGLVPVTVTGGGGQALSGVVVTASPVTPGLFVAPRATTDSSGIAALAVEASADLPLGNYVVSLRRGAVSSTVTVTVTSGVGRVIGDAGAKVPQGGSTEYQVRVVDGNEAPVSGVPLALSCTNCGLSFSPATATSGSGFATFTVTDSGGRNPSGVYQVVAIAGQQAYTITVTVQAIVGCLVAPPTIPASIGSSFVTVQAFDGPCDALLSANIADRPVPVPGVVVISAPDAAPAQVSPAVTGPDGKAVVWLRGLQPLSTLVFTTTTTETSVTVAVQP